MEKTKQLDHLFEQWENSKPEYQGKFIRDGIICEEEFERPGNQRVLIIAKEPNDPDQTAWDFRKWWKFELKFSFSYRIAEWAYGIQNDFPIYSSVRKDESQRLSAIQKIAFMNIKKIGGDGSANLTELVTHVKNDIEFIRQQIEIIDPDLIILCLSWEELRNAVFPELKVNWEKSGYDILVAKLGRCKLIDFYHPSSRMAPAASYSLLQNVIRSKVFQAL